jgi:dipeptidyl aminopeptidase/acylaminoacyl peptidase
MTTIAPYGSWRSPITAASIVADSLGLGQVAFDGSDVYWSEMRPVERGRNAIVRFRGGRVEEVLPAPFNARSRVHEYGGGAFTVADGVLYFCNEPDQRVYRAEAGGAARPITPESRCRYADLVVDRVHRRLIAVCEDHQQQPVRNSLVAIALDGRGAIQTLVAGTDFYAAPRISADGKHFAWLSWHHPDMPWDGSELWLADPLPGGEVANARRVAGSRAESIIQPAFAPDGTLYFVSDRENWWNLFRLRGHDVEEVIPLDAEVGWPPWVFGESSYGFLSAHEAVVACNRGGEWKLGLLHLGADRIDWLPCPCNEIHSLVAAHGQAAFVGASATEAPAVWRLEARTRRFETLRRATAHTPDAGYIATPAPIQFSTTHGATAYGFFYPPTNSDFVALDHERPPLLVTSHGGPTAAASPALNLKLQYWTSRGFAVLDVNYRGSSGFGREYRRALYGHWGVHDVDDCVYGARFLAERGAVDPERLAIRGGSAGGYTTLCALVFHEVFRAGAVYYGISDLEALARETHKFEQHYTDQLVGPYPASRELYRARSPIHHVARLTCPVIFFQGLDDKVVPPAQTRKMAQALRIKGIPVVCIEFEGEAHGFRRAENIKRALEAELSFYARIFGFTVADAIEPVAIENL